MVHSDTSSVDRVAACSSIAKQGTASSMAITPPARTSPASGQPASNAKKPATRNNARPACSNSGKCSKPHCGKNVWAVPPYQHTLQNAACKIIAPLAPQLKLAELEHYIGTRAMDRLREGGGKAVVFDWESYRRVV